MYTIGIKVTSSPFPTKSEVSTRPLIFSCVASRHHVPMQIQCRAVGRGGGGGSRGFERTVTEILVRRKFWSGGPKFPENFGPPDYYFQKILVRAWNNGPSVNTSV